VDELHPQNELEPAGPSSMLVAVLAMVGAWAIGQAIGAELRRAFDRSWSAGFSAGTRAARILEDVAKADPLPVEV
jgi:hypothetical protein